MLCLETEELHVKFYEKFELLHFIYPYPRPWTKVPLVLFVLYSFLISNIVSKNNFTHLFLGFGIGEDYPFRPDHGILLNETTFDANETTLETRK